MHNILMGHGVGKEDADTLCDVVLAQVMRDYRVGPRPTTSLDFL